MSIKMTMHQSPVVKRFATKEAGQATAQLYRDRPSRLHRKFVVKVYDESGYGIRRDVYSGRTARCTWLCTDGRWRDTARD